VLPVPMIALLVLVRRPAVMAGFALGRGTQTLAGAACAVVLALNLVLLWESFAG
jgi:manganese transport protein